MGGRHRARRVVRCRVRACCRASLRWTAGARVPHPARRHVLVGARAGYTLAAAWCDVVWGRGRGEGWMRVVA